MEPPETIDVQPDGCWILRDAYVTKKGYHRAAVGTGHIMAHVLVYRVLVGPVFKGIQLHHECHNRGCVNPAHLRPLTAGQHAREHYEEPTECPHGHAYPENSYRDSIGALRCKVCRLRIGRIYKANAKAVRKFRCARCQWMGTGADLNLTDNRCPECGTGAGRWGPQWARD